MSESDDAERPDPPAERPSHQEPEPDVGASGPLTPGHDGRDPDDTQPVWPSPSGAGSTSYPPPAQPPSPQNSPENGPQNRPQPGPPPGPYVGYGPPQPYGYPQPGQPYPPPQPTQALAATRASRLSGWAWPVITALALVMGLLGGVLAAVAVSSTLDSGGVASPPLSTDNGAAAPLKADNGSIAAVAARVLPSTVQVLANGGASGGTSGGATGSGFVLDAQHHVVTNNHVVADATGAGQIKVVDQDGRKHAARILGRSPVYDLAVLEVDDASGLRPAAIGSASRLRVGDTVVAIGSPLGLSSTVTSGIVSATNRPVTTGDNTQSSYINALQTDAAINPGNSGGPLANLRGQVIGVNSAIATTGGSVGGESGNIGVGFAIPMEQVRITAAQILATGKARYPVIGANVDTSSTTTTGAVVSEVPSGSPAARGGLHQGDVVTRVDGKPVTDGISLIVAIRSHQPGETVDLQVTRDGRPRDVKVRLDSKVG